MTGINPERAGGRDHPSRLPASESAAAMPPVVSAAASGKVERASLPAPARENLAARPGIGGQGNPPRTAECGGTAGAGIRTPAPARSSATEGTAPPVPSPSRRAGRQGPSAGGARNAPAVYPNSGGRGTQASDGLPAGASPPSSSPPAQGGAGIGAREGVAGSVRAAPGPSPAQSPAGSTRSSTSLPAAGKEFRDAWKKAQSEDAAAKRRSRGRYPVKRAGGGYAPGMARRTPRGGAS